jgi:hypothetical protein
MKDLLTKTIFPMIALIVLFIIQKFYFPDLLIPFLICTILIFIIIAIVDTLLIIHKEVRMNLAMIICLSIYIITIIYLIVSLIQNTFVSEIGVILYMIPYLIKSFFIKKTN